MPEKTNTMTEAQNLTDTIVKNICVQLSLKNWSLKTLADKSDLPYESVKKLINKKIRRPSFVSIWMIANALECSVDKLAGREDPSITALQHISENASEIFRIISDLDNLSDTPQ